MDEIAGDTGRQSLRSSPGMLERDFPDETLRIRAPVRTGLVITSLVFELAHLGRSPVVVYENVARKRDAGPPLLPALNS